LPNDASEEVRPMIWEAPEFSEIKMDAEINSYQDEFAGV
jgi:coenzyme PQQ precursor peptide PqqA